MQVFKAYFRIINKIKVPLMIYIIVFLGMSISFGSTNENKAKEFATTKTKVAFFNYDMDSPLINGLYQYLEQYVTFVTMEDDTYKLQEALLFMRIEYIIKIPKNFNNDFINGIDNMVLKTTVPDSVNEVYIDSLMNKYFNTVRVYLNSDTDISMDTLIEYVLQDLSIQTNVSLSSGQMINESQSSANSYYNFQLYSILMLVIFGVCTVMMTFTKSSIKMRNLASPIRLKEFNFQLLLGNVFYAILIFLLLMIASLFLFRDVLFSKVGMLLSLNTFVFTLVALSIAFLVSNLVKGTSAMSAIANVLGLGSSFICGAFVPQVLLSKGLLFIASFTPAYWYVKATDTIFLLSDYSFSNLKPILFCMLIQIGFGIAILFITMLYLKQKRVIKV